MPCNLNTVVNLDRYPINDLDKPQGRALIEQCRNSLAEQAICILPGFIREGAVARMVGEAEVLTPLGHYLNEPRIAYELDEFGDWPEDHPRHQRHNTSYRQVFSCHMRNDSLLRELFLWPVLTEFVRQALSHDELHTSACPFLAECLHIAGEGDRNGITILTTVKVTRFTLIIQPKPYIILYFTFILSAQGIQYTAKALQEHSLQ